MYAVANNVTAETGQSAAAESGVLTWHQRRNDPDPGSFKTL